MKNVKSTFIIGLLKIIRKNHKKIRRNFEFQLEIPLYRINLNWQNLLRMGYHGFKESGAHFK